MIHLCKECRHSVCDVLLPCYRREWAVSVTYWQSCEHCPVCYLSALRVLVSSHPCAAVEFHVCNCDAHHHSASGPCLCHDPCDSISHCSQHCLPVTSASHSCQLQQHQKAVHTWNRHVISKASFHYQYSEWLGSLVVNALDLELDGSKFNSQPPCCRLTTTAGKLFTPMCFCHQTNSIT